MEIYGQKVCRGPTWPRISCRLHLAEFGAYGSYILHAIYSVYYKEYFVLFLLQVMFALVTTTCAKKTDEYILTLKTHNNRALHINAHGRVTAEDISLARKYDSINQPTYIS